MLVKQKSKFVLFQTIGKTIIVLHKYCISDLKSRPRHVFVIVQQKSPPQATASLPTPLSRFLAFLHFLFPNVFHQCLLMANWEGTAALRD